MLRRGEIVEKEYKTYKQEYFILFLIEYQTLLLIICKA